MHSHRPTGALRERIEDFHVVELLDCNFRNEGEHLYLEVEKTNLNTRDVQHLISKHYGVTLSDVSYSGLKDKRAITRQWFSIRLPKTSEPPDHPGIKILNERKHARKLRIGSHYGNQFRIVIRNLDDYDLDVVNGILQSLVPNYFGPQRFGRNFKNIDRAVNWIDRGRPRIDRTLRYRHVSTLRSYLFNEVLAKRVASGTWNKELCGDISNEGLPTGPLWGRGQLPTKHRAQKIENSVQAEHHQMCDALEWVGLRQERRTLCVQPLDVKLEASNHKLTLQFTLPRGSFATVVVNECITVNRDVQ